MAWWTEGKHSLGDDPLIMLQTAVISGIDEYRADLKRSPTLDELLALFQMALNTVGGDYVDELQDAYVDKIRAYKKRLPKKQKCKVGDYVAIPLREGHAHGRLVRQSGDESLFAIYDLFSITQMAAQQIEQRELAVWTWKHTLCKAGTVHSAWRVLGNPSDLLLPECPVFAVGGNVPFGHTLGHVFGRHELYFELYGMVGIEPEIFFPANVIEEHLSDRVADPWPDVIRDWQDHGSGTPRNIKSWKPLYFRELPFDSVTGVHIDADKLSIKDIEFVHRLSRLKYLTIHCANSEKIGKKLTKLRDMSSLESIVLSRMERLTDSDVSFVRDMRNLQQLNLSETNVSDKFTIHIQQLTQLTHLYCDQTSIGDVGASRISQLSNLQRLQLSRTGITDKGVGLLGSLKKLRKLELVRVRVSPSAVEKLQRELPECKISFLESDVTG